MAYVVVGRHDESGVHEPHDHMQIPPGMLAVAVDHLNDALRLCRRNIDPSVDLVALRCMTGILLRVTCDVPPYVNLIVNYNRF